MKSETMGIVTELRSTCETKLPHIKTKKANENKEILNLKSYKNNSIFCNKNHQYLKNIMVGVIYRHPSNCIKTFMNNFEVTLQFLQYLNSPFYIG